MRIPGSKRGIELRPGQGKSWRLEPESGVALNHGVNHAVSLPFWLRLEPVKRVCKCRWIRIRYSSGFFDEPVRPLIRFDTRSGGSFVQPMNGAILGSAEWIGRVPDETVSISISPGRRLGPFSFRIDRIDVLSRPRLLQGGFFRDPLWTFWAIRSRMVDSRQEAWQSVKYAIGGTPLNQYSNWAARMERPFDAEDFDRPRRDWSAAPRLHLVMSLECRLGELMATLRSLRAQVHEHWSLHAVVGEDGDPSVLTRFHEEMRKDPRLAAFVPADFAEQHFADDDRIAVIQAGDVMPPYALATVAETLLERSHLTALYSDEDILGRDDTRQAAILKPDWSPIFYDAIPYVGRLAFLRYGNLIATGVSPADLLSDEEATVRRLLTAVEPATVGHIRRILCSRRTAKTSAAAPAAHKSNEPEPDWPEVSIVIPTRNRAHLLAACTRGLKETTDYPSFNVVVVDNGSSQPRARALLDDLRADARYRILDRPEPFNYAKLSNDGARATNSPMLVFLNNDIRMIDASWLKTLVRLAMKPQVGVVGAKLLFPNHKIQHAGIVLGMGGISGHIYRRRRSDVNGYLKQAANTREMAAVTGACIAIERRKFEAVGGFDAENLPVDLNDIDLCLRVAERGWTNVWAADAVLIHMQSASRGIERNPFDQYRRERTYFVNRWVEAIRDDPYFHPGFSLSAHRPVLA
ncbi:MAG TPA: glycosyltransferase [Xanthobacteraceae bacterium]|nr:glycosyltransferase [Xanthobacteraceae bacterium]